MRNLTLMLVLFVGMTQALAQAPSIEIDLTATEVTSQGQTGTCWSFSTTSFLESEVARLTGELHDLSEMAAVRVIYPEKVERFVRYQGKHQFGPGGLCHDVIHAADGEAVGLHFSRVNRGRFGDSGCVFRRASHRIQLPREELHASVV